MTEGTMKLSGGLSSSGVDVAVATAIRATTKTATIILLPLHEGIVCSLKFNVPSFSGTVLKKRRHLTVGS